MGYRHWYKHLGPAYLEASRDMGVFGLGADILVERGWVYACFVLGPFRGSVTVHYGPQVVLEPVITSPAP